MEAMGIDIPLTQDDLASRGNFAPIDEKGIATKVI